MYAIATKPKCEACAEEDRRIKDLHGIWPIVIPPHSKSDGCRMAA